MEVVVGLKVIKSFGIHLEIVKNKHQVDLKQWKKTKLSGSKNRTSRQNVSKTEGKMARKRRKTE